MIIIRILLLVMIVLLLAILTLGLLLGLPIGLGWVLNRFLPFSWFEASLLSMIAILSGGTLWFKLLQAIFFSDVDIGDMEYEYEDEDEIPPDRFWESEDEATWENWFRYLLANAVYEDMLVEPGWIGSMDRRRQQELSIRLADAAMAVLKRKAASAKRLRLTSKALERELERAGQQPYEDELLNLTLNAVNAELVTLGATMQKVARRRMWNKNANVIDVYQHATE